VYVNFDEKDKDGYQAVGINLPYAGTAEDRTVQGVEEGWRERIHSYHSQRLGGVVGPEPSISNWGLNAKSTTPISCNREEASAASEQAG
jgi:hypothetical protein